MSLGTKIKRVYINALVSVRNTIRNTIGNKIEDQIGRYFVEKYCAGMKSLDDVGNRKFSPIWDTPNKPIKFEGTSTNCTGLPLDETNIISKLGELQSAPTSTTTHTVRYITALMEMAEFITAGGDPSTAMIDDLKYLRTNYEVHKSCDADSEVAILNAFRRLNVCCDKRIKLKNEGARQLEITAEERANVAAKLRTYDAIIAESKKNVGTN